MENELDLELESVECKTLESAIELGETFPIKEYHILIKGTRIILVMHKIWQKCKFCNLENDEGICYLDEC